MEPKYKENLGLKIENDSEGVMQDTHWASDLYGYFPSYALGNIYRGQIIAKINKDIQCWRCQLVKGNLENIRRWLIKNVHSQGNLYKPAELIKKITGKKLDAKPYLYLEEKYSALYAF